MLSQNVTTDNEDVTFREWVDNSGGIEQAAALLGEKPRTVRSWYECRRRPRSESAEKIIRISGHQVDYAGLYGPVEALKEPAR
ncbi:hypothetical protein GCM10010082_31500 [Kushneria pakistanensis]|uniref:Helix-turn-helix domain-containing protein n=2 Tax=Kushneria pakistanensis TaxID=1508770 RepID=A0ABQ3FQU7_9GAMM|nr:hypothetical protein GCM10010082_31500 [Kushneria pakistanensis]